MTSFYPIYHVTTQYTVKKAFVVCRDGSLIEISSSGVMYVTPKVRARAVQLRGSSEVKTMNALGAKRIVVE